MKKQEFKKSYSDYRKSVSDSYYKGQEEFCKVLTSNPVYQDMRTKMVYPFSILIWSFKNKRGLL